MMNLKTHPMKLTLAVLAVAMAGSVALTAQAQPMGGMHHGHRGHMGAEGPRGGMHLSERMLDRIKATPEQRTQIRSIMDAARKDLQAQREAGRALREQSMQLFTQPNVDANAAEALRQKQLAQHDQASKRMMQAMLEASRVLTPEQRAQIAGDLKKRGEMMERHQRERRALEAPKS
jgi:Spy/CpxP family protein refolding chaperone